MCSTIKLFLESEHSRFLNCILSLRIPIGSFSSRAGQKREDPLIWRKQKRGERSEAGNIWLQSRSCIFEASASRERDRRRHEEEKEEEVEEISLNWTAAKSEAATVQWWMEIWGQFMWPRKRPRYGYWFKRFSGYNLLKLKLIRDVTKMRLLLFL